LRALAVTTATRSEALPDVPTLSDFLPGYEASFWGGFCAPNSTPAETVDKLNKEINTALADPKMKARIADLGATVLPGSPAAFGKLIADETEKWGKVIRAANINLSRRGRIRPSTPCELARSRLAERPSYRPIRRKPVAISRLFRARRGASQCRL
jgi:Tripartite tricarboxylate transporter family receptor